MLQNRLSKRSSLQERLEEPLGVDFGSILEPSWAHVGFENCLESTSKGHQQQKQFSIDFKTNNRPRTEPEGTGQRDGGGP